MSGSNLEFTAGFASTPLRAGAPTESPATNHRNDQAPRILLATTGHLPSTARLAIELHDAGAAVSLLAPRNHPAKVLDIVSSRATYRATTPRQSLESAMLRTQPDLVIPCDERTVRDLQQLHRETRHREVRSTIERSLGPPDSFPVTTSRHALLALAARHGARTPSGAPLPSASALQAYTDANPGKIVLKADGSWSGFGVRIVDAPQAQAAFAAMTRRASLRLALREMLLEGNNFAARSWLRRERPAMSAQSVIDGWPANIGVACWQGEILAATCIESVATLSSTGPSTVARIIDNPEMRDTAQRIVKALNLSGMIGVDFMIEAATGFAYLIEMNPRNTPICAIRLGPGRDLAEALVARLANRPPRQRPPHTENTILAFFPDTWRQDPSNPFLQTAYHDVPWQHPDLVRRLMRPPLRDRTQVMRWLRKAWWKLHGQNVPQA
jgi:hypothetical protein